MTEEIERQHHGGLAAVPEHLKDVHSREGLENVSREDLIIPRLTICQSTSPQRKQDKPVFIKGLNDGDLFNTVTQDIYGRSVELIPLMFAKSRIYFRDLKEGGGILCRSLNGIDGGTISPTCAACPNSQFGKDKPPLCTNFANFPSLLVGENYGGQMVAASWKSMALKPASAWITRMNMFDKPLFAAVYEVKSNPTTNAKGDFFVPSFTLKRWTTVGEYAEAKLVYESLKGKVIVTDEAADEEEQEPGAGGARPF